MKLFTAQQIRDWDSYTMQEEPIASIDLMERAATACVDWLQHRFPKQEFYTIFCGKGNNGGDGLAIARLLMARNCSVTVYIPESGQQGSYDFQANLERLNQVYPEVIQFIETPEELPLVATGNIIIDAILGTGINRPATGFTAALFDYINSLSNIVVAIDMPSGLYADKAGDNNPVIEADHTLSFQGYKRALLMADNAVAVGEVHVLPIGLDPDYYNQTNTPFEVIDAALIATIYKPRLRFAHKGNYGHGLVIAGSYGKNGAAVLACRAAVRSGIGLLTCYTQDSGYIVLQTSVPEAMLITDTDPDHITELQLDTTPYRAVGIGPGIGTQPATIKAVYQLLQQYRQPMVIDADALNILAKHPDWYDLIPSGSILTPHPKEFERLFGATTNNFTQQQLALEKAQLLNCIIIVKGHHSFIATPAGKGFYNTTGNAGMATGGSGDVLTGLLTGILAQGYTPEDAAIFGVYLHGLAGDLAAAANSMEAMTAGDIIEYLGQSFQQIGRYGRSI